MLNVPLVLASGSPRRIDLLNSMGLKPLVMRPDIEEKRNRGETPQAYTKRLAFEKANEVVTECLWKHAGALIIAADTIVVAPNGKVLEKPSDTAEAVRMVSRLQGKTHTVHTGYCVLGVARETKTQKIVRCITTKVTLRKLSKDGVRAYVQKGESMDKAGAYAAQEHGELIIDRIEGSMTNVIGLPMDEVSEALRTEFGISPAD